AIGRRANPRRRIAQGLIPFLPASAEEVQHLAVSTQQSAFSLSCEIPNPGGFLPGEGSLSVSKCFPLAFRGYRDPAPRLGSRGFVISERGLNAECWLLSATDFAALAWHSYPFPRSSAGSVATAFSRGSGSPKTPRSRSCPS